MLAEPIRDVHDVAFHLWADPDKRVGPARRVAVAHITAIRPAVDIITPTRARQSSRAAGYVDRLLARLFSAVCQIPHLLFYAQT
jgi:hypothetical protein